jgi:putative copper export protein
MLPAGAAAVICRRFSSVALPAVLVLVVTGIFQGRVLSGGLSRLADSQYGHVLGFKLILVMGALVLGALNRFGLTAHVGQSGVARWRMRRSVSAEAVIGLGIVLVAGCLASLSPGGGDMAVGFSLWGPAIPVIAISIAALAFAGIPFLRRFS